MRTERERLRRFFAGRPKARILMEASTISEWVARLLEELGHEVGIAYKRMGLLDDAIREFERATRDPRYACRDRASRPVAPGEG
jgi:transposase